MNFNSPKFKAGVKRVLLITACWILASLFIRFVQYYTLVNASVPNLPDYYNPENIIAFTIIEIFLCGIAVASFEVFYFTDKFRKKSFSYAVLMKTLFFTVSLTVLTILIYFVESVYFNELHNFLFNNIVIVLIMNFFIWGLIFLLTEFLLQVSDKYGQGVLMNFIRGRYHSPKTEIRIFMFLDMKSSTAIAETMGNIKYFSLLNEVFYDLTDSIINSKGEVYQYVGDEVVISWKFQNGIEKANCINCFFEIEETLRLKKEYYLKKFDVMPVFKAGLHYGEVTVGEIGVLKRDITFSGDVLNTASRIQELCNVYGESLIVSGDLIEELDLNNLYSVNKIGEINLRGRTAPEILYGVKKMTETGL